MELIPTRASSKAPAERFTGDVWVDEISPDGVGLKHRIAAVHFTPGARTAWHMHPAGQTLYVTDGIGYVQSRGGDLIVLRPGDVVWTPPGEWHWHGAAAGCCMTHIASSEIPTNQPMAVWGEHVGDDEYPSATPAAFDQETITR